MVRTSTLAVILAALIISVIFTGEADGAGLVKRAISTVGQWAVGDIPQLPATKIDLADGNIIVGSGTTGLSVNPSGDVDVSNTGVFSINGLVIVNADISASAAIDATKIADGTVTSSEFQFINSLTSNAQTQMDGKAGVTRINGASGAAGADITWQKLSANSAGLTSTTPAVVMTTTGVGVGVWHFKYLVIFQSAATTTGMNVAVNHSGTSTRYSMMSYYITTGGAASTAIHDGTTSVASAAIVGGKGENTINTATTATVGVSTANVDKMMIVEGMITVSVSGNLELKMGTEVAASAITVQADSLLELNKIG